MKSLIFTLIICPIFLFSQNSLRVNFSVEHNTLNTFDLSSATNFEYIQISMNSGSGVTSVFSIEKVLNKNWSWHNGVNYSAQSFLLETAVGYYRFDDVITIQPIFNSSRADTRHRINFSSLSLFSGVSLQESFGKFGLQTAIFTGAERYLSFENESIVIDEFDRKYGEKVAIEGDDQPNQLYAFGKISTGIFYDLTPVLRISGTPFFSLNFNKTKAVHLDNRFYKFGVALGLSYQIK